MAADYIVLTDPCFHSIRSLITSSIRPALQLVQSGSLPFPLLPAESGAPLCGGAGSGMNRGKKTHITDIIFHPTVHPVLFILLKILHLTTSGAAVMLHTATRGRCLTTNLNVGS